MLATLLDSKLARNYLAFLTHNIFDCWRVFRVPLAPIQLREGTKLTAPRNAYFVVSLVRSTNPFLIRAGTLMGNAHK
jgi:hypothetical protein